MITKTIICPKCGQEFEISCTPAQFNKGKYKHFCSRKCANSRTWNDQIKSKIRESAIKYRMDHEDELISNLKIYSCRYCGKEFTKCSIRNTGGIKYCSSECREQYLKENIYPKFGGYRKGSGRGKHGWYKGYWCDSSYELSFLIYHIDHDIPIERCTKEYKYQFDGKTHTYHPDFIVNDQIVEIKGYHTKLVDIKSACAKDVSILYKEDIQYCIDYVTKTYDVPKHLIYTLYDNYKPRYEYSCTNCGTTFYRDNIIKTQHKFCCRKCAGVYTPKRKNTTL